ncbi:MAG: glutamate--tRNA ligase [Planctomycetota bacterium]|nr:glutamate--tRNA ligase [Planctomycetota bacterium]
MSVRVRFAPSPTGHVHIGNIRVAIFNWLFARHEGGKFLLRIEDTDRERSTPAAIQTLLEAMQWLGLDYDEEPVYQSRQLPRHRAAAERMIAAGFASTAGPDAPIVLHLDRRLFDPAFVTDPREEVDLDVSQGDLYAEHRGLVHVTRDSAGQIFQRPIAWDAMPELRILAADGDALSGDALRAALSAAAVGERQEVVVAGKRPAVLRFRRRFVFFDDLVLGRMEKPLDSIRDFVIMRSDGTPVFHLANVVDDIDMRITHILRGNDHVENTFRHLFIFKALGATPPKYGHFPMIVNSKGKPYSKRDGDAYVGDFKAKGYLPECLFNFLALCGWSSGDNREIMSRQEMIAAFSLSRVNAAPAQFNLEKLAWMNGQYLMRKEISDLVPLVAAEVRAALGEAAAQPAAEYPGELGGAEWLARLIAVMQEHVKTLRDFVVASRYFFLAPEALDPKAVEKVLAKNDGAGWKVLAELRERLASLPVWSESALEEAVNRYAAERSLKLGEVAQPLRVALTGGTASRGIFEVLHLVGRRASLQRIDRALQGRG